MARLRIKERSQRRRTIEVQDDEGNLIAPSTLRWRLDCVTTQTEVLTWQTVSALPSQVVTIPASATRIINNRNPIEVKRFTVQANYGTDEQLNGEWEFDVTNNEFYT